MDYEDKCVHGLNTLSGSHMKTRVNPVSVGNPPARIAPMKTARSYKIEFEAFANAGYLCLWKQVPQNVISPSHFTRQLLGWNIFPLGSL